MTLIDDTCDGCGIRFDPMGDPLLTKHLEIGPYAVCCATCEARSTVAEHEAALVEKATDALMRTLDTIPAHTYGRHAAEFEVRAVLDAVVPAIKRQHAAALLRAIKNGLDIVRPTTAEEVLAFLEGMLNGAEAAQQREEQD